MSPQYHFLRRPFPYSILRTYVRTPYLRNTAPYVQVGVTDKHGVRIVRHSREVPSPFCTVTALPPWNHFVRRPYQYFILRMYVRSPYLKNTGPYAQVCVTGQYGLRMLRHSRRMSMPILCGDRIATAKSLCTETVPIFWFPYLSADSVWAHHQSACPGRGYGHTRCPYVEAQSKNVHAYFVR